MWFWLWSWWSRLNSWHSTSFENVIWLCVTVWFQTRAAMWAINLRGLGCHLGYKLRPWNRNRVTLFCVTENGWVQVVGSGLHWLGRESESEMFIDLVHWLMIFVKAYLWNTYFPNPHWACSSPPYSAVALQVSEWRSGNVEIDLVCVKICVIVYLVVEIIV